MRASLENVTTADAYTRANTLRLPGTRRITLQIANAGVLYELDESEEGKGQWTGEGFLAPSIGSLARVCSGIRFRSKVAGVPAQVTCELLDEEGADSLTSFTSRVSATGAVDANVSVAPGSVIAFAGAAAPSADWLLCDGSAVSRIDYATLLAAIGVVYGAGDGATTFNLPDLRGRVAVGKGSHADVDALGENDGSALASRRPRHKHSVNDPQHAHPITPVPAAFQAAAPVLNLGSAPGRDAISVTGGAATGITVGPQASSPDDGPAFLTLNYLIKT